MAEFINQRITIKQKYMNRKQKDKIQSFERRNKVLI